MALKSGLSIYCYTLPTSSPPVVVEYAEEIIGLTFTTVAPGGMGQLTAVLELGNAQLPRPELQMFSRIVLMSGTVAVFVGEITDPALTHDDQYGEYVSITALGIGNCLRDDPANFTYANKTVQYIASNQLTARAAYLPLDQDTSAIFPDNPSGTFNPAYAERTMEEIIGDVAQLAGDYQWGVWPHPINRDAAGFPTGQLQIHVRDTATTHYQASMLAGDITKYSITPSAERAYNVIKIDYAVSTTSGYTLGTVTYTDPRLAANGSQGTAPFRRRVYGRDLSSISTVNQSQAQSIANTYGAQYQNPSNKVSVTLVAVRDAQGITVPLWSVQADRNLFIPELASRGAQLATAAMAGVNQFYVVQTTYTEQSDGTTTLEVEGDNFIDKASLQVARLQLWADGLQRAQRTTATIQAAGAPESGGCGFEFLATTANQQHMMTQPFRALMTNTPSSITLTTSSSANMATHGTATIRQSGFQLYIKSAAAGDTYWFGTYQTVGNCLVAVDVDGDSEAGTVVWHCDGCEQAGKSYEEACYTFRLPDDVVNLDTWDGSQGAPAGAIRVVGAGANGALVPGQSGLSIVCPTCGLMEAFNTALAAEDEDTPGNAHRGLQARLIRALMAHPAVGLSGTDK